MSEQEIKEIVWQVARDSASRGPSWAQEGVVLRAICDHFDRDGGGRLDLQTQQLS